MAQIRSKPFGVTKQGANVTEYILSNPGGLTVSVLDYGCIIKNIIVPAKNGPVDVVLGHDTMADYEDDFTSSGSTCCGAFVGRYANRIKGGRFTLNGKTYTLAKNNGENHLHGGDVGFDKKMWDMTPQDGDAPQLRARYVSPDGEEGYPGTLTLTVTFTLRDSTLSIAYDAESDADTVANFTNHAYFNLNGQGSGDVLGHLLQLNASAYTPADAATLPTGEIAPVDGTCMDFRTAKPIGQDIHDAALAPFRGYDTNFCLDGKGLRKIGQAEGDQTGIVMEVETTLEGVQLYTGNFISDRAGKNGARYASYSGFCLETQHYPDAINQPAFPSPVLRQGEPLHETTVYRFCVRK